jgi:CMP-N,N'-diacetyllegionaminic acid synthase
VGARIINMLAIIPARGGSKGIPDKNIIDLAGKPLIAYTIQAAKEAPSVSKIVVSTDDKKIAEISRHYGAEVPFFRPSELATDDSPVIETYLYTIERLQKEFNQRYEGFIVLQPTSPLRTAQDIENAVRLFREKDADSVISVTLANHPPFWAKKIDDNGVLRSYFQDTGVDNRNRQNYPETYLPNGVIFIFKYSMLRKNRTYYSNKTYPYVMPKERSLDIDDKIDLNYAECLFRNRK